MKLFDATLADNRLQASFLQWCEACSVVPALEDGELVFLTDAGNGGIQVTHIPIVQADFICGDEVDEEDLDEDYL